jgi:hypothetical protein
MAIRFFFVAHSKSNGLTKITGAHASQQQSTDVATASADTHNPRPQPCLTGASLAEVD